MSINDGDMPSVEQIVQEMLQSFLNQIEELQQVYFAKQQSLSSEDRKKIEGLLKRVRLQHDTAKSHEVLLRLKRTIAAFTGGPNSIADIYYEQLAQPLDASISEIKQLLET